MTYILDKLKFKFLKQFTFYKNDVKYFYKRFDITDRSLEYLFNELVAYKMARKVGINSVKPIIINKNDVIGMATKSFEVEGYRVINGYAILKKYFDYLKNNKHLIEIDEELILSKMNNLEDIWDALNFHFKDFNENLRKEIVSKIMIQLTEIFSFDIIMMQVDRHDENWEIMESENENDAYLTPLYDNELCFSDFKYNNSIHTEYDIDKFSNMSVSLKRYLISSSPYFINKFVEYFKILTPDVLREVILKVDDESNHLFKYTYKEKVITDYETNYNLIKNVLLEMNLIEKSEDYAR